MSEPYARGGERDARWRAINGVADLEWVCTLVDRQLKAGSTIGPLRLCYSRQRDAFQWRVREQMRRSRSLTEGDWEVLRRKCRLSTWRKMERAESMLVVRAAARAVLRLAEWVLTHGETWREQTVTLRWACGENRRAIWGCFLSGGMMRRGQVREEDGRISGQLEVVERLTVQRPEQWRGEVMGGVEHGVQAMEGIDRQLQGHKHELRNFVRLYYRPRTDAWELRQITGPRKSRYLSEETTANLMAKLSELEQQRVGQVVELMGRRKKVKRMLQMIATLVEAAACWPGGTWQLRGEAPGHAGWTATTTAYGLAIVTDGTVSGQTFGRE